MKRIFHITTGAEWARAQQSGRYAADSLETEGFIHCSDQRQVLWVANSRFFGRTDLVLLHVDCGQVGAEVRYENLEGGNELFPHVYGAIPLAAVVKVTSLSPGDNDLFGIDTHPG